MMRHCSRNRLVAGVNYFTIELVSYPPIDVQRFMLRHPTLQTVLSRMMEKHALERSIRSGYYTLVFHNHVTVGNIYEMDETGNGIGALERASVIVDTTPNSRYQSQTWASRVRDGCGCICADGNSILPVRYSSSECTYIQSGSCI